MEERKTIVNRYFSIHKAKETYCRQESYNCQMTAFSVATF